MLGAPPQPQSVSPGHSAVVVFACVAVTTTARRAAVAVPGAGLLQVVVDVSIVVGAHIR